jgi:carbon-monoxide dehydrogenase large subunit
MDGDTFQKFGLGQPVRRKEDPRLLTGRGRYVDDINLDGQIYAQAIYSPYAHARILSIDTSAAEEADGVVAVLTGKEWAEGDFGPMPVVSPVRENRDGSPIRAPFRPCLALDRVLFVGDIVAFVLAESSQQAKDAAELVEIDYDPLPHVLDARAATADDAPQLWDDIPNNICLDFEKGDEAAVNAAFEKADHVVSLDMHANRVAAAPIEPRGALAEWDAKTGTGTLYNTSQNIHANRDQVAKILGVEPANLRHVAYDVGGGFGVKNGIYPEHVLVVWAAMRTGRPVKWLKDRTDSFIADIHGRDQKSTVELALDKEGTFLALKVRSWGNIGGYAATNGPFTPTGGSARTQGGPYRMGAMYYRSSAVFTNTSPTAPYRGAGRPEATYHVERVIDYAAHKLGFDPIELRRKNALTQAEMPHVTPMGLDIDSGAYREIFEQTLDMMDYGGFAERRAASEAKGLKRGIGSCLYLECSGGGPKEFARILFEDDGRSVLSVGSQSTGMGHETALPQIIAARLGIDFDSIDFVQADTAATPIGGGHGGSRGMEVGGGAVMQAVDTVIAKARRVAAQAFETAVEDVVFEDGAAKVVGTDRVMPFAEILSLSKLAEYRGEGLESGLDTEEIFERNAITVPSGSHVIEVEVDPDTGVITLDRYAIVDDFGNVVNPMLADGQVMGGAVQGIGQAMLENIVYDDEGQLLSASFMDYALPRASDVVDMDIRYFEGAPTKKNPLGVKGAGEAGCVGAMPAVVNAVMDALKEYGIHHIDMPLTPMRVWKAIEDARS